MKLADMESSLTLEGEFEEVGEKPALEPPEATEGNTIESETGQRAVGDY